MRFIKCFTGNSARIRLNENEIYKGEALGKQAFDYFKKLRDKHVVHDENAYTQCIPMAAINAGNKSYKVEKILTISIIGETLEQGNYQNLHQLATVALRWVEKKYDELCDLITNELEAVPYLALRERPAARYTVPDVGQLGKKRTGVTKKRGE
jgi:hypothetical protein